MFRANHRELGTPEPLGATCLPDGVNFAVYSEHAERIELVLFDAAGEHAAQSLPLPGRTANVWHGFFPHEVAGPGTVYGYRVHGKMDTRRGLRFDASKVLLDPYARDLIGHPPRAIVTESAFDWQQDSAPAVPWRNTIIYEMHVKGFTALHPDVPAAWRGKYLGLTAPAVLDYLESLGVTAVQLLPVQAFLDEPFLHARQLGNYWGYNPIGWFAPDRRYAVEDPIEEFKRMVHALHGARIEVILDVVFNHTAEGDERGQSLSLRGIDNPNYYRLGASDKSLYEDLTGCGNTVNCAHPAGQRLVLDCLRYWAEEMHIDGFRFDLATVLGRDASGFDRQAGIFRAISADSGLSYLKMIAEPWDLGVGGYQLGNFPTGWSEWNDRYRDAMRGFWRGDRNLAGEFAERFAGSSDIFRHRGRRPAASINFITAHDGFTLRDLVSYANRHNEANLEANGDGQAHNLSCNHGVEGETDDPAILEARRRHRASLLATLFLSQGVPMLQAGDEIGRTQRGNNNAYCQDNEISWIDWQSLRKERDLLAFVSRLVRLRAEFPELRRETFLKGLRARRRSRDVGWYRPDGREMSAEDWRDPERRSLAIRLSAGDGVRRDLLFLINAGGDPVEFKLPSDEADIWRLCFDTAALADADAPIADLTRSVGPQTAVLLSLVAHDSASAG